MSAILMAHINEIIFAVATIIGMIAHYVKKRFKYETTVNLREWFGSSNWPGSITSIGTAITIIIAALSNGVITETMPFWSVVYVGLTTGFAVDSTTNMDQVAVGRSNYNENQARIKRNEDKSEEDKSEGDSGDTST